MKYERQAYCEVCHDTRSMRSMRAFFWTCGDGFLTPVSSGRLVPLGRNGLVRLAGDDTNGGSRRRSGLLCNRLRSSCRVGAVRVVDL